jgi:hypothetical protein
LTIEIGAKPVAAPVPKELKAEISKSPKTKWNFVKPAPNHERESVD